MRPKRKIRSTKLSDFYYPVTGKTKYPAKNQKNLQKTPVKTRKSLVRSIPSAAVTNQSPSSQIAPSIQARVEAESPEPVHQEVAQRSQSQNRNGDEELDELYTNTKLPSGYSGQLKQYILQKESISRHKRRLNIFKRRKVFVLGPWVAIQADTAFYISSGQKNDGYKYILGKR
jgi:hypothetical protein